MESNRRKEKKEKKIKEMIMEKVGRERKAMHRKRDKE